MQTSTIRESIMGRLVRARPQFELTGADQSSDDYLTRVAKYIPSEIVAGYLSLLGFIKTVDPTDEALRPAAWGLFGLCWFLTPIYMWTRGSAGDARKLNTGLATAAFPLWAYALGGVFELVKWYKPWLASLLLGGFTLAVGAIPVPRSKE